jgi:hypothetical protein
MVRSLVKLFYFIEKMLPKKKKVAKKVNKVKKSLENLKDLNWL